MTDKKSQRSEKNIDNINIEKLDFESVERENISYTMVHTIVIQTITDHYAGFIWVYLQSLPPDWKINKEHLLNHFGIGEDKLKKHMSYLNKTNLIEYIRRRNTAGELGKVIVRALNGTKYDPYGKTSTGVKTTPMDNLDTFKTNCISDTTGVINHPVVDHTSGFYPPYTNTIKNTNNNNFKKTTTVQVTEKPSSEYFKSSEIRELLQYKNKCEWMVEVDDEEVVEIFENHCKQTEKDKGWVKPKCLTGLKTLLSRGTFYQPKNFISKRKKEVARLNATYSAAHTAYLSRFKGDQQAGLIPKDAIPQTQEEFINETKPK